MPETLPSTSASSGPRVRFAPSPTGFLHVGSARTFIFNWLYARHNGGTMILRLDDTDVERNTQASVDSIFEGLKWLNLSWDEAYKQSERIELHRKTAAIEQTLTAHGFRIFDVEGVPWQPGQTCVENNIWARRIDQRNDR